MSDASRVEVEGADALASTLHHAAEEIGDMSDALDDAGRLVQTRARGYAPVDTGALAASIEATRSGVEVHVGSAVGVYAGVQEYGSATTPAHPYLRPALDYSQTVILGYFERDANKALAKVKGA